MDRPSADPTAGLTRHRVHQSLVRTPLYAGVEKGFLLFEGCTAGFLFFVLGFRLVTFVSAAIWLLVLHPLMAWVCAKDPILPQLYVRSLTARDYYTAHAVRAARAIRPKLSLPKN